MPAADPLWPKALARYPFAATLLPGWREHAADLPADYQAALDAALIAFDPERPLDERYRHLLESRTGVAALLADGDEHIGSLLLSIRIHRAMGENANARQFTAQLQHALDSRQAPKLDRPFLPALEVFDQCLLNNPQDEVGDWLQAIALDTAAELEFAGRHTRPVRYLAQLAQRRKLPSVSIVSERRLALTALRLGKKVTIKPGGRLVTEGLNPNRWVEIAQEPHRTQVVNKRKYSIEPKKKIIPDASLTLASDKLKESHREDSALHADPSSNIFGKGIFKTSPHAKDGDEYGALDNGSPSEKDLTKQATKRIPSKSQASKVDLTFEDISILIPTYKRPNQLEACVKSISESKMGDRVKVLIGNNGASSDLSKVGSHACEHWDIRTRERNIGSLGNITALLESVQSRFAFMLTDDDELFAGDTICNLLANCMYMDALGVAYSYTPLPTCLVGNGEEDVVNDLKEAKLGWDRKDFDCTTFVDPADIIQIRRCSTSAWALSRQLWDMEKFPWAQWYKSVSDNNGYAPIAVALKASLSHGLVYFPLPTVKHRYGNKTHWEEYGEDQLVRRLKLNIDYLMSQLDVLGNAHIERRQRQQCYQEAVSQFWAMSANNCLEEIVVSLRKDEFLSLLRSRLPKHALKPQYVDYAASLLQKKGKEHASLQLKSFKRRLSSL